MGSIYITKRKKLGLSKYSVAKELGISLNDYIQVESGKKSLPQELVDKFLRIDKGQATGLILEYNEKLKKYDEELKSGELRKLLYSMGYGINTLAESMGLPQSTCSYAFNIKGSGTISADKRLYIYDFLHNPLNKLNDNDAKKNKFRERNIENNIDYTEHRNKDLDNYTTIENRENEIASFNNENSKSYNDFREIQESISTFESYDISTDKKENLNNLSECNSNHDRLEQENLLLKEIIKSFNKLIEKIK